MLQHLISSTNTELLSIQIIPFTYSSEIQLTIATTNNHTMIGYDVCLFLF